LLRWLRDALDSGQTVHVRDGEGHVRGARRPGRPLDPTLRNREITAPARGASPPLGVLLVAGDFTHQPNYAEAFRADPRCRLIGLADEADVPDRRRSLNE